MSKLFKTALLAMAATAILSGPVEAGNGLKNVSFSVETAGEPPNLTFKHANGKWVQAKKNSKPTVKFHVKAERKGAQRITTWYIRNMDIHKTITLTKGMKVKKIDKVVMHKILPEELEPFIPLGRKVCEEEGNTDKSFKKNLLHRPEYLFRIASRNPVLSGHSDLKTIKRKIPLQVICLPEPLKVKNIDVKVKYEKLPGKCKVKAHLQAVIKTNKKSKQNVSFWYYRDNGDRQQVTVKTQNSGIAYFNKYYTFKKSESRKYLINVGGDHPYQTKWTAVKVNCAGSGSGGFQTAPKPNTH